ncbi:MAG: hypothetical protein FWE45_00225 [Firmicutes bacterium]|nr:hypothetical protein [Bacillota bacterium]
MFYSILDGIAWFAGLFSTFVLAIIAIALLGLVLLSWIIFAIWFRAIEQKHGCCRAKDARRTLQKINAFLGLLFLGIAFIALAFAFTTVALFLTYLTLPIAVLFIILILNFLFALVCRCRCVKDCSDCVVKPIIDNTMSKKDKDKEPKIVPAKNDKPQETTKKEQTAESAQEPVKAEVIEEGPLVVPFQEYKAAKPVKRKEPKAETMEEPKQEKPVKEKPIRTAQPKATKKQEPKKVVKNEPKEVVVKENAPIAVQTTQTPSVEVTTTVSVEKSSTMTSTMAENRRETTTFNDGTTTGSEQSKFLHVEQKSGEEPKVFAASTTRQIGSDYDSVTVIEHEPVKKQIENKQATNQEQKQTKQVKAKVTKNHQPNGQETYSEDEVMRALAGLRTAMQQNKPEE